MEDVNPTSPLFSLSLSPSSYPLRLVVLLGRPCLDDALAHSDVDGRIIVGNMLQAKYWQKPATEELHQQPLPAASQHSIRQQNPQNGDAVCERGELMSMPCLNQLLHI